MELPYKYFMFHVRYDVKDYRLTTSRVEQSFSDFLKDETLCGTNFL